MGGEDAFFIIKMIKLFFSVLIFELFTEIMREHIQVKDLISVNFVEQHLVKDQIYNLIREQLTMMTKDINVKTVVKGLKEEGYWITI